MSLRFHEYTHADHRILNPFSARKFALLGERANVLTHCNAGSLATAGRV